MVLRRTDEHGSVGGTEVTAEADIRRTARSVKTCWREGRCKRRVCEPDGMAAIFFGFGIIEDRTHGSHIAHVEQGLAAQGVAVAIVALGAAGMLMVLGTSGWLEAWFIGDPIGLVAFIAQVHLVATVKRPTAKHHAALLAAIAIGLLGGGLALSGTMGLGVVVVVTGLAFYALVRADPLDLFMSALALSAATAFPVITLSIWWKRLNVRGAAASIIAGFALAMLLLLANTGGVVSIATPVAGAAGALAAFVAAIVVTLLSGEPQFAALEATRDMRIPGGETIYDREMRQVRFSQRESE